MTEAITLIVCAGGAGWELPLLRDLQRPGHPIRVVRRCVEHGELLGTALRDRPRAVLLDAGLGWLDLDLVATLARRGVAVIAVGERTPAREALGIGIVGTDVDACALAAALEGITSVGHTAADAPEAEKSGRLVVVWGASGAPGRTTVAAHLAIEAARRGDRVVLVDGDAWSASIAQLLELDESPSVAQAARLASHGWPTPLADCLQAGPDGLLVLTGLPRAELWPEVRPEAWDAVLAAATQQFDTVVVDVAAPIEEDEELVADRIPFRRNAMTTTALDRADRVVLVTGADPIGLRRGVVTHQQWSERATDRSSGLTVVLNRTPGSARQAQDCSRAVERWVGTPPAALLPVEPTFTRVVWEGRPLQAVAPRSPWLRELRGVVDEVVA